MTLHQWAYRVVLWAALLVAAGFAVMGVWDLLLIVRGQLAGNSASGVVKQVAMTHPWWVFITGFVFGALMSHLLWYQKR